MIVGFHGYGYDGGRQTGDRLQWQQRGRKGSRSFFAQKLELSLELLVIVMHPTG